MAVVSCLLNMLHSRSRFVCILILPSSFLQRCKSSNSLFQTSSENSMCKCGPIIIIFKAVSLCCQKTQVLWSQIHPTLPQPPLSQLGASGPVPVHIYFLYSKILTVPIYLLVNRGRILVRNPDKSPKSFPPCYLPSPLRVFLLAIHSHLCSFALGFLFLQTHATSYSFYSYANVHCKGVRRKT
jgi:hypothetical protein